DFELDASALDSPVCWLEIDSVDTFAAVLVNDREVGRTANQFLRYRFDVKKFLKAGSNRIEVKITSAAMVARARSAARKLNISPEMPAHELPEINLIRKMQCSAGWDWGIALPLAGIYGGIRLLSGAGGVIDFIHTRQQHYAPGRCRLEASAEIFSFTGRSARVEFEFMGESRTVEVELKPGANQVSVCFEPSHFKLWWPHGCGEQPLYELTVRFNGETATRRIGLRRIEAVYAPDEIGNPLTFRVNGRDIFIKGADWIPPDAFPARCTPELYRETIASASAANMNMLRVWGGGVYESDLFYDICDESGLLVWQDMMFACAIYPSDDEFLAEIAAEAEFQAKRLRHHACIALWCGDNECLGSVNRQSETPAARDLNLLDYDRYHRVLEKCLAALDPDRLFWHSSPSGGPGVYNDGWQDDTRGDMHYWDVWHGRKPFEAFYSIRPRFCSEFGFQSFPLLETVESFTAPADRNVFSPVMMHHQKSQCGNEVIIANFARYFRMPDDFGGMLYLSQVQQAVGVKTAVEYWRSLRPRCMGVIYWQLNDCWPVASWSSIDYGGAWKALHYQAARFYAPVIITARPEADGGAVVTAVSDLASAETAAAELIYRSINGEELGRDRYDFELSPGAAEVCRIAPERWAQYGGRAAVLVELKIAAGGSSHENAYFPSPWQSYELPEDEVKCRISLVEPGRVSLERSCRTAAYFVWLSLRGLKSRFDDNSFHIYQGEPLTRICRVRDRSITCDDFAARLRITHLAQVCSAAKEIK
ncbi:MAG: hypothetical protein PHI35_01550, partial [Victivallaceae bacterium]|nr:hypothetical protein [Victivallaceae bacterium]